MYGDEGLVQVPDVFAVFFVGCGVVVADCESLVVDYDELFWSSIFSGFWGLTTCVILRGSNGYSWTEEYHSKGQQIWLSIYLNDPCPHYS